MQKVEFNKILTEYMSILNIKYEESIANKLYIYMEELIEWNKKINLTAIIDEEEIILKHFIDSIVVNKYLKGTKIIDIGTGAGFPGIPLKVINKGLEVTLLDSLNKRVIFLSNIINKLEEKNIVAEHGRAEDFGRKIEFREKYDVVVSRAVAELKVLSEYMLPFSKIGGISICMKGSNIDEVLEAEDIIKKLGGKIEHIEEYNLPNSNIKRNIIIIKKTGKTPLQYPRKPNQIKPKK